MDAFIVPDDHGVDMNVFSIPALVPMILGCNTQRDDAASVIAAFDEFSENVTAYIDGDEVVIETTGLPDHTSPYWSTDHELYVEPTVTSTQDMAPGTIDNFNGTYTLRVPVEPTVASSSTATGMGAIGIAVSGAVIYNDQEGENVPIDDALPSLDYTGAHTGPQSYHYHLEPIAWSQDDDALIGIMADGFFLYGRKSSDTGDYPTDLDSSGGHSHAMGDTADDTYHYHIVNEVYANEYYLLFSGDFQGTPSTVQ